MTYLYCPNCHRQLHKLDIKMGVCFMCTTPLDTSKFIGVDTAESEERYKSESEDK